MECFGVVLKTLSIWTVPGFDGGGSPRSRLVPMAFVAGIGRAELRRKIRTRNPQAVIVARIDDHVSARRHVARWAADGRVHGFMMVMSRGGVFAGGVALQACAITGRF